MLCLNSITEGTAHLNPHSCRRGQKVQSEMAGVSFLQKCQNWHFLHFESNKHETIKDCQNNLKIFLKFPTFDSSLRLQRDGGMDQALQVSLLQQDDDAAFGNFVGCESI